MNRSFPWIAAAAATLAFAAPLALAQAEESPYQVASAYPEAEPAAYSDAVLDQTLAPIALYPDQLLSQILMAATYPLEVVQAARWSRGHPNLLGDEAVAAVEDEDWDPSVKSLVAFPQVLAQMDRELDWTQRLGEAFLADQDGVMASVQRLRTAALDAGNLSSGDEIVVRREQSIIVLDSPVPDTIYVPCYDSRVVYGNWWWPSYPPVWWSPWPGYYAAGGYGFAWSVGVPVGVNFFFGNFDWGRHYVRLYDHHPFYYNGYYNGRTWHDHLWRHDPYHRRDVQYRNPIARVEFGGATVPQAPRSGGAPMSAPTPAGAIARPDRLGPVTPLRAAPRAMNPLAPSAPSRQGFVSQRPLPRIERGEAARPVAPRNALPGGPATPAAQHYFSRAQFGRPAPAQPLARPAAPAPAPVRRVAVPPAAPRVFVPQPAARTFVPQPVQRVTVPQPAARVEVRQPMPQPMPQPVMRSAPAARVAPPPAQPARAQPANPLGR